MYTLKRTDSSHPDFLLLVKLLDAELALRDGADHGFYDQFNKIDMIKHVVVIYDKTKPVGCGAIKQYDSSTAEVKRMYVVEDLRGRGIASGVLLSLEAWAAELGYTACILETGKKQPEAIALYSKSGYTVIPNYGQYEGIDNSVCFKKAIR